MCYGVGMRISAATLPPLGRTSSEEMTLPSKSARAAPSGDLSRENVSLGRRRQAKKDAFVATRLIGEPVYPIASSKYILTFFQASCNQSYDRYKPGGRPGCVLGHTKPFIQPVGGAEGGSWDSIWVDCYPSEARKE